MARSKVADDIVNAVAGPEPDPPANENTPSYELIGDASIPVSKKAGPRWKGIIDEALTAYKSEHMLWDSAFDAYRRCGDLGSALGDNDASYKWFFENDTDENLIRENVKVLLRNTYTQNPDVNVESTDGEDRSMSRVMKLVLTSLLRRATMPGVNAKPKVRRAIVHAHLTNFGVIRIDYQGKVGSRQEAIGQRLDIRKKLADANDQNTIDDLYAQLEQVEEELPIRDNGGIRWTNTLPHRFIVDPNCTNVDLSDADWCAEEMWLDTAYIRNRYMEKDENNKWVRKTDRKGSKAVSVPGTDDERTGEKLRDAITEVVMGYTSEERRKLIQSNKTQCWLIWDRLTREILLFTNDDWSYPLWVFEDTLGLSRFFQHTLFAFSEPVDGVVQSGESAQYAGHAKEINKINQRIARIRRLAFGAFIYNARKFKGDTIEKLVAWMNNPEGVKSFGLDWDPEVPLEKLLEVFIPPDAQVKELFDKSDLMRVVDRMNSISPLQRGDQFKTNTTNDAVAAYSSAQATVTNEQTDAIEGSIEELCRSMAEIVVSKFSKEDVAGLIGTAEAEPFTPMSVEEFNATFNLEVAAGTTQKPTSENSKKEAMGVAQAIGQVGSATPMTSFRVIARMLSKAFPAFLWGAEDEASLTAEAQANMQKGISTPQGAGQAGPPAGPTPPTQGGPPPQA